MTLQEVKIMFLCKERITFFFFFLQWKSESLWRSFAIRSARFINCLLFCYKNCFWFYRNLEFCLQLNIYRFHSKMRWLCRTEFSYGRVIPKISSTSEITSFLKSGWIDFQKCCSREHWKSKWDISTLLKPAEVFYSSCYIIFPYFVNFAYNHLPKSVEKPSETLKWSVSRRYPHDHVQV